MAKDILHRGKPTVLAHPNEAESLDSRFMPEDLRSDGKNVRFKKQPLKFIVDLLRQQAQSDTAKTRADQNY